jgi:hypothetical protein
MYFSQTAGNLGFIQACAKGRNFFSIFISMKAGNHPYKFLGYDHIDQD